MKLMNGRGIDLHGNNASASYSYTVEFIRCRSKDMAVVRGLDPAGLESRDPENM